MATSPSNPTLSLETSVGAREPAPGKLADLFDLGDDDLVADGGTKIMRRDPVSDHPSSLPALTAALEAKKLEKGGAPPHGDAAKQVQMLQARPPVGRKPPRIQPTLPSRVATAVGPVGLPAAPKTERNLEDLAFESPPEKVERTQPFRRGLFGSGRGVDPTLESPVWRPRPSGSYPPPDRRPTSIAPISVDVSRSMPPSWSPSPASYVAPKKSHAPIVAAVVAGCVGLCAIVLVSAAATVALAAIKVAVDRASEGPAFAAEQQPYEPPPALAPPSPFAFPALEDDTAADPVSPLAVEPLDDETTVGLADTEKAGTRARSVGTGSGAHAPPPPTAPATTAPRPTPEPAEAEAPAPTTGVVQVSPSLMTVLVDGDDKRVSNARVVVTCGRHRIDAGRGTRIVDVPCGGVATVP
jgi:hypothetical protein